MALTLEQLKVAEKVALGENVRVTAHAGSGKTRTLIESLRPLRERQVLFLEFNRALRKEAYARVQEGGLTHVNVQNYDSLLVNYYDRSAPDVGFEVSMQKALDLRSRPFREIRFDVLVIDEAQDMTWLYDAFVRKAMNDNPCRRIQIVLVGDTKQTINHWRAASEQYMLEDSWPKCQGDMCELQLSATFRFGSHIADFVNFLCRDLYPRKRWGADVRSLRFSPTENDFVEKQGGQFYHFVLDPTLKGPPLALLSLYSRCVEDVKNRGTSTSVGVLARSIREEVTDFWKLIEFANALDIVHRECSDEDVPGGVTLRTVYTTKGKQYTHLFLFVLEAKLWCTKQGNLIKNEENLVYVGLTRAVETLVVIECKGSRERVFSRLWTAATERHRRRKIAQPLAPEWCGVCAHLGNPTDPNHSSNSLAFESLSVESAPGKRNLIETLLKSKSFSLRDRIELIETLQSRVGVISPAQKKNDDACLLSEERGSHLPGVSTLESTAAGSIIEYRVSGTVSGLHEMLQWCRHHRLGENLLHPERFYVRVSSKTSGHLFLPRFETLLFSLPLDVEDWTVRDWACLCLFHPRFHYGHLVPERPEVREDLVSSMVGRALEGQERLQKIEPISASGLDQTYPKLLRFNTLEDHSLFLAVENRDLILSICESAEFPRAADLLAASFAAYALNLPSVGLRYLDTGAHYAVQTCDLLSRALLAFVKPRH